MNTRRRVNGSTLIVLVLVVTLAGQVASAAQAGTGDATSVASRSRISEAYHNVKLCQADLADASLHGEGTACLDALGRGWRAGSFGDVTGGNYYDMKERQAEWTIHSR